MLPGLSVSLIIDQVERTSDGAYVEYFLNSIKLSNRIYIKHSSLLARETSVRNRVEKALGVRQYMHRYYLSQDDFQLLADLVRFIKQL